MSSKEYFIQKLYINDYRKINRFKFLRPYVENKSVLHVGFVDYPITDISKNLHLNLSKYAFKIDGVDPNLTTDIEHQLRTDNGNLYSDWSQIKNEYDIIIVPEVIEHVDNLKSFLETLDKFNGILIVTAPDAYSLMKNFLEIKEKNYNYQETVHPDHNCWFSPYTLKNVIEKYCKNKKVIELCWIKGSIAIVCK